MSFKWYDRRYSKSLLLEEQKDFLARKSSILSSEPLEDMLSCPIHLGIFEKPIQLPCGHSFCLECIEHCLKTQMVRDNHFACPVCRVNWPVPVDGAHGWPLSYALNDIISYLKEQKNAKFSNRLSQSVQDEYSRKNSILEKADVVRKLADDIANKKLSNGSIDKIYLIKELNLLLKRLEEPVTPMINNNRRRSSVELKSATESTRLQMSQLCEYKVAQEPISKEIFEELKKSKIKDCIDLSADVSLKKLIFVNSNEEIVIYDYNTEKRRSFVPMCNNDCLKPVYLRLFHDYIFLSALIISKDDGSILAGILVKYNLDGKLLEMSEKYTKQNNDFLPVYGFDLDGHGNIYLALPDTATIAVLSSNLKENQDKYVFSDPEMHPNFVCYSNSTKEIWASCPLHKSILILDEITGSYMQFGTVQLFNSEPSHIIATQDDKICFLDSKLSRVFWIKRQNDYLCIQRLAFGSTLKKMDISLLRGFFYSNFFLLVTDKFVYHARPSKATKEQLHNESCCVIG